MRDELSWPLTGAVSLASLAFAALIGVELTARVFAVIAFSAAATEIALCYQIRRKN